jgi:hypothetical protein
VNETQRAVARLEQAIWRRLPELQKALEGQPTHDRLLAADIEAVLREIQSLKAKASKPRWL